MLENSPSFGRRVATGEAETVCGRGITVWFAAGTRLPAGQQHQSLPGPAGPLYIRAESSLRPKI
jgi:hypothetical protein